MSTSRDTIVQLFETTRSKEGLLRYVRNNPTSFDILLKISFEEYTPDAWRAAWLVGHTMQKHDSRIVPYLDIIIAHLKNAKEGHQRQLIIILLNMDLNEEQEGKLFDTCLSIWEQINCIPSTRVTALKFILKIAEKFPELKEEVKLWTQEMYLETLSPGIKNSVLKQVKRLQ